MSNPTNLSSREEIARLMRRHGLSAKKAMGQNFIASPEICPKIAELSLAAGRGVLEIGPGLGALTAELCKLAEKVVAVELDSRLIPVLQETLAGHKNVEIINADVLKIDLNALCAKKFAGLEAVAAANLPYYITSPIIMALLEQRLPLKAITVMAQKEAAQRICAPMPSRAAGALTAAVRWRSEPELLFEVPPEAFSPPPDVTSAVLRLTVREEPPCTVRDEDMLFRVVKGAFSQRRKTVLNCFSSFFAIEKPKVAVLLGYAGVDSAARAEQLSLCDFARIADCFCNTNS